MSENNSNRCWSSAFRSAASAAIGIGLVEGVIQLSSGSPTFGVGGVLLATFVAANAAYHTEERAIKKEAKAIEEALAAQDATPVPVQP